MILEPEAARGWPSAIAPPFVLVLARSRPSSFSTERNWAAKASFTYRYNIIVRTTFGLLPIFRGGGWLGLPLRFLSCTSLSQVHSSLGHYVLNFAAWGSKIESFVNY